MDRSIASAFDFIAIPKEQFPGGAIQTSTGDWAIVLPFHAALDWQVGFLVGEALKVGPIDGEEIDAAIAKLQAAKG